ncbi:MAG: RidA family protein [Clostridiales bacterium]|uniref:RidA family protein n=1 Tax=Provencibacterium massiliense TaxID=1841868 RepID=UPI0009A722FB|nr:RidA family protein [Provencibacterium massiliense]PWM36113.1 MAG: RidA family protein [Clostridiales bacterium]RGB68922.1 RidA family protein [Harryflintia acetispora]
MKTVIDTKKAPGAIGPYSQAIVVNGMLYTSGQIPINPADGSIPEGITAQTEQVIKNIAAILEEAGTCFENAIKTTCFIADMGDFGAFNEVYAKYFTGKPARSCVAVKTLPKNVLVEVEVIAVI